MAHFTVHDVPSARFRGDDDASETKQVLVKEGFSWSALVLPGVWFISHGHLLSFLMYLTFMSGVGAAAFFLSASVPITIAALFAANLLAAFEANKWRRFLLRRRGAPAIDMATGVTARAALRAYSTEIKAPTFDIPSGKPDLSRLKDFEGAPVAPRETPRPRLPDPPPAPATVSQRQTEVRPTAWAAQPAPVPSSGLDTIMQFAGLRDRPFVPDQGLTGQAAFPDDASGLRARHGGDEEERHPRVNIGRRGRRRR